MALSRDVFLELRKVPAFVRRDFLVAWSYRVGFFTDWLGLFVQVVLFAFVGRLVDPTALPRFGGRPTSYVEFVTVGIALSSFVVVGLSRMASAIRNEQLMGTLELLLMTPISLTTLLLGSVMYEVLYVPIRTVLFLVFTSATLDARFRFAGLGPAMGVIVAFVPVVWGLGILSAAATLTFRRGAAVVGAGSIVLMSTSSTYFPVRVLPGWLAAIAQFNPLTIALGAIRGALLGGTGWLDVISPVLILLPMGAASLLIGLAAFRLALRRELRRGTLGLY